MEARWVEGIVVWSSTRVVTIWLVWVQVGKWWNCVRVCSVEIDLRLRSAQSALAICASETRVPQ